MNPRQMLITSHDVADTYMAGSGSRYREVACVLARRAAVTLAVPGHSTLYSEAFTMQPCQPGNWESIRATAEQADALMPCGFVICRFPQIVQPGYLIVVDS